MTDIDLTVKPAVRVPTYRLVRLHSQDRMLILTPHPAFLASHWRHARSFPCCQKLVGSCPWCDQCDRREHAYLGVLVPPTTMPPYRAILEAPPGPLFAAMNAQNLNIVFGSTLISRRTAAKATPEINLLPFTGKDAEERVLTRLDSKFHPISQQDILRTLCKIYALPDPLEFKTTGEWKLAVKLRISSPDFTPAKHQPPSE